MRTGNSKKGRQACPVLYGALPRQYAAGEECQGHPEQLFGIHEENELIVIDEVGFIPLHKESAELLFQVISDCYERKSLIIISNLEFSQWNTVFGDSQLTAALIDRLIHRSHIVTFSGESYRLTQSMRCQRAVRG